MIYVISFGLAYKSSLNFFNEREAQVDFLCFVRQEASERLPEPEMRSEALWESLDLPLPCSLHAHLSVG